MGVMLGRNKKLKLLLQSFNFILNIKFHRNIVIRMASSGMLRHVALVRTDISEELSASFIKVTRIGELGTILSITSNRRMLR
jgi:hypothetical protein